MSSCPLSRFAWLLIGGLALLAPEAGARINFVRTANHSSSAVTVTWTTPGITNGLVNYGTTTALGQTEWETRSDDDIHFVTIGGLAPSTTYYFEVVSAGETDDNGGAYYTFATTPVGAGLPYSLYGHIELPGGLGDAADALATVTVVAGGVPAKPLAVLSDAGGWWLVNLGNLKHPADGSVLEYATGDSVLIDLKGVAYGAAQDTVLLSGISPQSAGELQLITAVPGGQEVPGRCPRLVGVSPNPFNPRTWLWIEVPAGQVAGRLTIHDLRGRLIATLGEGPWPEGRQAVMWDGRGRGGRPVPTGSYLARLVTEGGGSSLSMLLVR